MAVMPNGSQFDFYLSGGVASAEHQDRPVDTAKFRGSLEHPATTPVYSRRDFFDTKDTEKWWIEKS